MSLKRLREVLNDPLFVRTKDGMEPTQRAFQAYEGIEKALAQIQRAVYQPPASDPLTLKRTFRFAAPDDLEMMLIPALLEKLQQFAPQVRLVVRPSDFRSILGGLDSGDADLALTAMPDSLESWHRHQVLYRERFSCVFDPKQLPSIANKQGRVSITKYLSTPHVLLSPRGELHSAIDERLARDGKQRQVLLSVAHFPLIPFVLRRTPCLANIPAKAAQLFSREFGLVAKELPIETPTFDVALLWHARSERDPAVAWFKELVREILVVSSL